MLTINPTCVFGKRTRIVSSIELKTLPEQLRCLNVPFSLVADQSDVKIGLGGSIHFNAVAGNEGSYKHLAFVPQANDSAH